MLISGFFFFFITCILYTRADLQISKSSASYLAKLQWDEVQATLQEVQSIINKCLATHDKLEASLRDLSRTGDIQACKAARKAADGLLKDLSKELKPLLSCLQSSPSASHIYPKVHKLLQAHLLSTRLLISDGITLSFVLECKVEELVTKEKELQERVMAKQSTVVDGYEKKSGGRDIENRIASQQQRIIALRQEVEDLLELIDEI